MSATRPWIVNLWVRIIPRGGGLKIQTLLQLTEAVLGLTPLGGPWYRCIRWKWKAWSEGSRLIWPSCPRATVTPPTLWASCWTRAANFPSPWRRWARGKRLPGSTNVTRHVVLNCCLCRFVKRWSDRGPRWRSWRPTTPTWSTETTSKFLSFRWGLTQRSEVRFKAVLDLYSEAVQVREPHSKHASATSSLLQSPVALKRPS